MTPAAPRRRVRMKRSAPSLEPQRVDIDPRQRRDRHRGMPEEQAHHPSRGQREAAKRHRGDEDLAVMLEIADLDPQAVGRLAHRDLVGLVHRLKGGDVHALLEAGPNQPIVRSRAPVQHVGGVLSPGGVGHLSDHAVDGLPVLLMEEEEGDRVEADPQITRVREQPDGPRRPTAQAGERQVAGPLGEGPGATAEIVTAAKPGGSRPAGRPERDAVEQLGQLGEVEQGQEDPVVEGARHGSEPAMRDPALVDGGGAHAASASSRAPVSTASASAGRSGWGNGPRPPSASETRSADQTPSSWNPQRQ